MKRKSLFFLVLALSLSFKLFSQYTFSVSPGLLINTAHFGYQVKENVIPCIGFQYLSVNATNKYSGMQYDWDNNSFSNTSNERTSTVSFYVPYIGVKYFVKPKDKLNAYFSIVLSKPFIRGDSKIDGIENDDFEENLKNFKIFGGELGFGAEYFFDEKFSLGGEFGIRYFNIQHENTYSREIYNGTGYEEVDMKNETSFALSPTYSKITLNFYF